MRKRAGRLAALILMMPVFCCFGGEALTLRCAWTAPDTGEEICFDFTSAPMIVAPAGGQVRIWLLRGGSALPLSALVEVAEGGSGKRMDLTPPPAGVTFRAPSQPGLVRLAVVYEGPRKEERHPFAVYVPHRAEGTSPRGGILRVGGRRLGRYSDPLRSRIRKVATHPEAYRPPELFVPITDTTEAYRLSPRLEAGMMVIRDEETGERHSRWFPVCYRALSQAEALFDVLREAGLKIGHVRMLSVFRTPDYNRKIGSSTFSRHPYGDAIDFFFDGDDDGAMDDLTGDGRVTIADALRIIHPVEAAQADGRLAHGGIGVYYFPRGNEHVMTFHIDFRGHRATWGYQYGRGGRREFEWTSPSFPGETEE